MGFEQKFERGLSDRNWTKSLLAFVDPQNIQSPQFVAELVEKALCADYRDGAFPNITKVTEIFHWVRSQLADTTLLQLYVSGSNETEILEGFEVACGPLLEEVAHHPETERFVDMAYDHLRDACLDHSLYGQSHQEATKTLVNDFMRQHAVSKLEPAIPVCINKHGHSPERTQARRDNIIRAIRLNRVVHDIVIGKEKLRAPKTQRENITLNTSLL